MLFKKPKEDNAILTEKNENQNQSKVEKKAFYERPRVCAIDLLEKNIEKLKKHKFNCFIGTLGSLVEVPNSERDNAHLCLPNFLIPENIHEYDIVIINLQNQRTRHYNKENHERKHFKGYRKITLVSTYPETLFDPRAFSAAILRNSLSSFMKKESILIVFADEQETITYYPIAITSDRHEHLSSEDYSIYDFYDDMPGNRNLTGKDTVVLNPESELGSLLARHNNDTTYSITFNHPIHWENNTRVKDKNFLPLMCTGLDQIISFARIREKNITFFFPYIQNKDQFLVDLFDKVLPGICPKLFPHNTQFLWKSSPEYRLPNENELINKKKTIEEDYNKKINEIKAKIDANRQEYGYLHDLLTQSGDLLVKAIEKYLVWLGFDNVINMDEINPRLKEEDLRVETKKGLLVIEIKGIGGTSTDSECSQVSKFKYRRAKERDNFDVFGLYLVNHERYLPPNERANPPFNANQIQDAKNDERGLLTTYELFKLYFNIIKGFVTKEDAILSLFQHGLVEFNLSKAVFIAKPLEIHYNGFVAILQIKDIEIHTGMPIIIKDNGYFRYAKIEDIQTNGKSIQSINEGEIGIRLSERVNSKVEFWKKLRFDHSQDID
ncbi:MAG: hypothetical protein GF353_21935 [Candidatus Lokiarchaeota archaeon]|nr:hypothetical protein [Candidatus Lokiarchaeota archaeon]